ncbi:hypothetical protein [Streptosporangium sandarakinum]|uniref:hypothetical protein n=1 Tax=Streptosporangium sandarakinum TaxID=1260955 RepID=UPI0037BDE25F
MSSVPSYHLYTSEEAAERTGGNLPASLFKRLAASRKVEVTYIGRKVRWTDEQIAAAVAYHARGDKPADARPAAPSPQKPRTASAPLPHAAGSIAPLRPRPEAARRYGRSV